MTSNISKEYDNLERALHLLRNNVADFSIGAISLDDYRPVENKIEIVREALKRLRARMLMLEVKRNIRKVKRKSIKNTEDTKEVLENVTARKLIRDNAIKQCYHSIVTEEIIILQKHKEIYEYEQDSSGKTKLFCIDKYQDDLLQKLFLLFRKMYEYMKKLFMLNDTILSMQNLYKIAFEKQLDLKIQCQKEIFNYRKFLQEEDEQRKRTLQKTNPRIVKNKERMTRTIHKINIMKKFITNLVATSGKMLQEEPFLLEMLEKHAELINEETILKLTESTNKDKA